MGGSHSRTKGHSFERLIAIKLRETGLDPGARRNVQETQVASVDILTDLPLAIQCKCIANWSVSPHSVWNQANEGKLHPNDMPLGIVKITRKEPTLCIVSLDHMLEMLLKIYGKKEKTDRDS